MSTPPNLCLQTVTRMCRRGSLISNLEASGHVASACAALTPRASVPVSSASSLPCVHLFIAMSAPFSPMRCLVLLEANAAREQVQSRNEARAFHTARGDCAWRSTLHGQTT